MPAVRAMKSGTSLSVTWVDGTTTSWDAATVAEKVSLLGRDGAAAFFQSELLEACNCESGVSVEDTGSGFSISVET